MVEHTSTPHDDLVEALKEVEEEILYWFPHVDCEECPKPAGWVRCIGSIRAALDKYSGGQPVASETSQNTVAELRKELDELKFERDHYREIYEEMTRIVRAELSKREIEP